MQDEQLQASLRIAALVGRYIKGELDTDQMQELQHWMDASEQNRKMVEALQEPASRQAQWEQIQQHTGEAVLHAILYRAGATRRIRRPWAWTAAAIFAGVVAISTYFLVYRNGDQPVKAVAGLPGITPGSSKAVLTLSDGSEMTLDSAAHLVIRQGATALRQQGGILQYEPMEQGAGIAYNTLATPRGGQFQLVLSDGTKVWLNAASSIRYPAAFTGKERKVEVSGEAYFEVAKNTQMPFRVEIGDQAEIEVLGTHFNINAYQDEGSINTVLLEGAISIKKGEEKAVLYPGQQAQIGSGEGINIIKEADVEKVMAWKNGLFAFRQENIPSIMRQLSRWYDVDVVYTSGISDELFTGTIGRFDDISKILRKITFASGVHFKVEGKKITVSK